jgi:peptidoglycan-associated lipoprotein
VRVHFATDSAEIAAADQPLLDQSAQCLKQHERLRVTVEGNADKRGTKEYNLALGQRRAEAVAHYLAQKGVSPDRLQTMSFGKDRPLCDTKDPTCLARNRRTAIRAACRL